MHKLIIYTVLEKNINRVKIYVLRQPTHTGYNNNNNNNKRFIQKESNNVYAQNINM